MYFPYLRGKQFELIALRELAENSAQTFDKVSPVIEPVKESSTLNSTLKVFKDKNLNFNLILNPQVGDFKNTAGIISRIASELSGYNNFQPSIIIDQNVQINQIAQIYNNCEFSSLPLSIIHCGQITGINEILTNNLNTAIKYNFIYTNKTSKRYYREFNTSTRVTLDDFFHMLPRNADYLQIDESDFSEEHLHFNDEGYVGFSDFLTIGDNYQESGFLPYAVAIHLSFKESMTNKIKIKHFASDSNDDQSDIAGKFAEALEKLVTWANQNNVDTFAVREFKDLRSRGHFPGLGSIKKLSIMHHIELVTNLL